MNALAQELSNPTQLVGNLEAETVMPECVPAGLTSASLTLNRTSVQEGHERTTDHFVSERQQTGQS